MKKHTANYIKKTLLFTINSLLDYRDELIVSPNSSFTRTKKISFEQTMLFPMVAGSDNTATELIDMFDEDKIPLPSAMIQRRNQIKPEAFKRMFLMFTQKIPISNTYEGYQIVACDGTRINLPYNPSDSYSHISCIKDRKGINQVHLNSLYDPLNDLFLDADIQGIHDMNENDAFISFLDKYTNESQKRIYIADRGYGSYNIFSHALHNQQKFLIRVSRNFVEGMCTNDKFWLKEDSCDKEITVTIGRRKTKELQKLNNYHCIPSCRRYDYLEAKSNQTETLSLRVLKFKIKENTYEYIVTNLSSEEFSLKNIKELYQLRWGEEVAFRHLKYAGNMVHIHSLKKEFLIQEIYAKLTMYNFSTWISSVAANAAKSKSGKYLYVLNHAQVQKICARFIKNVIRNVIGLIFKYMVPVRPGRKFARHLRRQSADTLTYR